jgi:putative membrane protein
VSPARIDHIPFEWQPDVWLLMTAIGVGYVLALRRVGPRVAPGEVAGPRRVTLFFAGLVVLTIAASWPLDIIGDGYLFSVHMLQYLLMSLVAAPLLLAGIPGWLLRELVTPIHRLLTPLIRPLVALLAFNFVLVVSHWPVLIELYLRFDVVHLGMHVLWVGTGVLFWLPVLSPLPEFPRLNEPLQMGYLFLSSVIPTVPASFLTWAEHPLYDHYAAAPRLWGVGAIQDIQAAGLVMKLGGGFLLWSVITVIFFRWATKQEHRPRPQTGTIRGERVASGAPR